MKTTIELPDELLRRAKAAAARQGRPLKAVFAEALSDHLARCEEVAAGDEAWRDVFGKAEAALARAVDEIVKEDLERVELESWR